MRRLGGTVLLLALGVSSPACTSSHTDAATPIDDDDAASPSDASDAGDAAVFTSSCTSAREQFLLPIDEVSSGEVRVVSNQGGVMTLYVDASAGGASQASKEPRVYVDLAEGARVDVTDVTSLSSVVWDLALERTVIFTNGGDGGPGQGAAALVEKAFASVTAADADAASPKPESFFDDDCNPKTDPIGAPLTAFSSWYDYDQATNIPTPRDVTYIVKGGTGERYKVAVTSYNALPDGGARPASSTGYYLLEVSSL